MATARPVVRYADTGRLEELRQGDVLPGAGSGGSFITGVATISFGVIGNFLAEITVPAPTITYTSIVSLSINPTGTLSHTVDEHLIENYTIGISSVTPGVGFKIAMNAGNKKLFGDWKFNWALI